MKWFSINTVAVCRISRYKTVFTAATFVLSTEDETDALEFAAKLLRSHLPSYTATGYNVVQLEQYNGVHSCTFQSIDFPKP